MISGLENFAAAAVQLLWKGATQGSAVLLAAWAICRIARLPASLKCWVCRIAFLKVLLLVVWVEPIYLPLLPAIEEESPNIPAYSNVQGFIPAPGKVDDATQGSWFPISMLTLWTIGVMAFVLKLIREWFRLTRIVAKSVTAAPEVVELAEHVAKELKLRNCPAIRCSDLVDAPLIFGLCRPVVLFPSRFIREFGRKEQEMALAHEFAHRQRQDLVWAWVAASCKAIFFFNPIVWLADKEWRLAQEVACDLHAIETTKVPASFYGNLLLRLCSSKDTVNNYVAAGLNESWLKKRIQLIINCPAWEVRPNPVLIATLAALTCAFLLPWKLTAARSPQLDIAWGKAARGIQLGLQRKIVEPGLYGFTIYVRNITSRPALITYPEPTQWRASVANGDVLLNPAEEGNQFVRTVSLSLKPGQSAVLFKEGITVAVGATNSVLENASIPVIKSAMPELVVTASSEQSFMMLNNEPWPQNLRSGLLRVSVHKAAPELVPSIFWGAPRNGLVAGIAAAEGDRYKLFVQNISERVIGFTFRELQPKEWSYKIIKGDSTSEVYAPAIHKPGPQVTIMLQPGERFLIGHPHAVPRDFHGKEKICFLLNQKGDVEVDGVVRPWSVDLQTGEIAISALDKFASR